MDTDLKAKWIAALRSGEYEQADGMLHDTRTGSYCCLGVLCKVMGAEFGPAIEQVDDEGYVRSYDHVPYIGDKILSDHDDEELKKDVCNELGIPDQAKLIQMNDGNTELGIDRHSFSEIADYIEKNIP